MFHVVARTLDRRPLWITDAEGVALWDRVLRACPEPVAVVLMPDHVHVLHRTDVRTRLAAALSGHTRSLGHAGTLVAPLPESHPITDDQKLRRQIRYVHLNPYVRADPPRFHAWVSADGAVDVAGTELPVERVQLPTPEEVLHAVSAVTRTPLPELGRRGPPRALYLRAARTLTDASARAIAGLVGTSHSTVLAHPPSTERDVRLVARVAGDPRFPALDGRRPWWRRRT